MDNSVVMFYGDGGGGERMYGSRRGHRENKW